VAGWLHQVLMAINKVAKFFLIKIKIAAYIKNAATGSILSNIKSVIKISSF